MSGVVDFGEFERKTCASCGYYWDYNIFDLSKLSSNFDKMFFIDVDYCPNCFYVGYDIDKLDERVKKEIDSGKYKKKLKPFNAAFTITSRQEAFQFVVYAEICEEKGDFLNAAICYHNGAILEKDILDKYFESELYSDRDEKDKKEYEERVKKLYQLSEDCIRKYLAQNDDKKYKIFLCGLMKKQGKKEEFARTFKDLLVNNKFEKEQIPVLKELGGE